MENYQDLFIILVSFAVLALAAGQIGQLVARFRLPLISGFLFAGMLVGPFVLGLISTPALEQLRFIDEISLAFIAFAAGSELHLKELRGQLKSILSVTIGNAIAIPILGSIAIFLMAEFIPFMEEMSTMGRAAVSLLAGAILLARSPSSAIAIINELRAKGPFTQTTLGVTMVSDVAVIVIFAINVEIADALLADVALSIGFVLLLVGQLAVSLLLGVILGRLLQFTLALPTGQYLKSAIILALGYGVFVLSAFIRQYSHENLPFEFLLEPLLIAMIGSFIITNYSPHRPEFLHILEELAPTIYIIFFTLTGASLALDVLAGTLLVTLALFSIRLVGIFLGSFTGGLAAGDPMKHNTLSWMAYVTQAGVGLGLAKEVAVEFPGWGADFATVIIGVIVVSQIIGPPFFKWAITHAGEAHPRGEPDEFDGRRDAVIFGAEGQALALAQQLIADDWHVKVVCQDSEYIDGQQNIEAQVYCVDEFDLGTMRNLQLNQADAAVMMLADDVNYRICELLYEYFGTPTMIVRLNKRANFDRFHELGALIIEPSTAMVALLEQFVRSPTSASMLLGMQDHQEIIDIEVRNKNLEGLPLRDLRLPLDTLVLSVSRDGHTIISHGYTKLKVGDQVTVLGSHKSVDEVSLMMEA